MMKTQTERYFFHQPEEIYEAARMLAAKFPLHRDILLGIYELLLNAVEHGNLAIERQVKHELLRQGIFSREITRRLALPEHAQKCVEVSLVADSPLLCHLVIRDQGEGFDWRRHLEASPQNATPSGRGLLIAKQCGFSSLTFNERGNAAICGIRHSGPLMPEETPVMEKVSG